jgi:hypothetical protein
MEGKQGTQGQEGTQGKNTLVQKSISYDLMEWTHPG